MDPKQNTPTLDPKLQEVYDRVMGTTPTLNPDPTIPTPPNPSDPIQTTAVPPIIPTPADTPTPAALSQPQPAAAQAPVENMQATISTPLQMSAEKVTIGEGGAAVATDAHPKGKGISPVVLIFGAFAFLVVYAVFWIRFFGLNLPFLPH